MCININHYEIKTYAFRALQNSEWKNNEKVIVCLNIKVMKKITVSSISFVNMIVGPFPLDTDLQVSNMCVCVTYLSPYTV